MSFSPDAQVIEAARSTIGIAVWKTNSSENTAEAISPYSQIALPGVADKTVGLWDLSTLEQIRRLYGHNEPVACVALAASASEDTVLVWDLPE